MIGRIIFIGLTIVFFVGLFIVDDKVDKKK